MYSLGKGYVKEIKEETEQNGGRELDPFQWFYLQKDIINLE